MNEMIKWLIWWPAAALKSALSPDSFLLEVSECFPYCCSTQVKVIQVPETVDQLGLLQEEAHLSGNQPRSAFASNPCSISWYSSVTSTPLTPSRQQESRHLEGVLTRGNESGESWPWSLRVVLKVCCGLEVTSGMGASPHPMAVKSES